MISVCQLEYQSMLEVMKGSIETGFKDYDRTYYDLKPGEITILFGRDGEGKSTVVSQIIAHHISQNKRVYLFSGELSNNKIQEWLYKQVVGSDSTKYRIIDTKYGPVRELKPKVVKALKKWHEGKFAIYDTKIESKDGSTIFDDIEIGKNVGYDLFVIDNLMTAFAADATTQHADQSNFIQKCKNIARNLNVHIIIVAHANKQTGELEFDAKCGNLTKNDISGIKNISNKADNILAIERIFKTEGSDYENYDMYITSLKDRFIGQRHVFGYNFHSSTLRLYNDKTPVKVTYDWEKYYD